MEDVRKKIVIEGTSNGLGIRIVGGRNLLFSQNKESDFGIFVKEVIKRSLAEKDGRLKRGDQLLEVNGITLMGVSNESAVGILKNCALTNRLVITISRDSKSRQDFRRLSDSLLLNQLITPNDDAPAPTASSTPRSAEPVNESEGRQNGYHEGKEISEKEAKRQSTSSELTEVSVTDSSSHGDDLDNELMDQVALNKNLQRHCMEQSPRSIALSDVQVEVEHGTTGDPPPPVPNSPPPSLEVEDNVQTSMSNEYEAEEAVAADEADEISRNRISPEGKAVSPPLLSSSNIKCTFVIPKTSGLGLGIIIGGGMSRVDGPYITIDKILEGMDAAKDGNLEQGDKILSINGESFMYLTRDKALRILKQLQSNYEVTSYNITIERSQKKNTSGPSSQSLQKTTSPSIFDSETLLSSESSRTGPKSSQVKSSTSEQPFPSKKSTPHRYHPKKDSDRKKERAKHDSLQRNRFSMDAGARCKLEKLEWALKYMGHNITPRQQEIIRSSLDVDDKGKVIFFEFVKLAKDMFAFKLDDSRLESNLMLALNHDLEIEPIQRKSTSYEHIMDQGLKESVIKPASSQPILPLSSYPLSTSINSLQSDEELESIRRKLDELETSRDHERNLSEHRRKELEKEKERSAILEKLQLKDQELLVAKKKIASLSPEILQERLRMAKEAHKAERDRSNEMEDTIRELKAELSVLRNHQPEMTIEEMSKRMAINESEIRKEKSISCCYQAAVERLMQFVGNCHEALVKSPEADRVMYYPQGKGLSVQRGNIVTGNPRPPQYLSRHAKLTATTLAQEAQETMAAVRKLIETEVLPFGWEEVYTEDGRKYYMNHETKTTSWVHPVTKVVSTSSRSSGRSQSSSSAILVCQNTSLTNNP